MMPSSVPSQLNRPKASAVKNRKILWWMLLIFSLPIVAAKLILFFHWYHSGVTNYGVWISPKMSYQSVNMVNPAAKLWQIGYIMPQKCLAVCQQQLALLHQSHVALGKDQPRVATVILVKPDSDKSALSAWDYQQVAVSETWLKNESAQFSQQDFVVIDPLGDWVMRYPVPLNAHPKPSQNIIDSGQQLMMDTQTISPALSASVKGLLGDLRKLLKLSRVG
ncbi:hypothetical protein [Vibrio algicola]|nr:hypothetical protein [Vibrio algicola]